MADHQVEDEDKYQPVSDDPMSNLILEAIKNDDLRKMERAKKWDGCDHGRATVHGGDTAVDDAAAVDGAAAADDDVIIDDGDYDADIDADMIWTKTKTHKKTLLTERTQVWRWAQYPDCRQADLAGHWGNFQPRIQLVSSHDHLEEEYYGHNQIKDFKQKALKKW